MAHRNAARLLIVLAAAAIAAAAPATFLPKASQPRGQDGGCANIGWTTLTRTGKQYGSGVWGAAKSEAGKDLAEVVNASWALPATPVKDLAFAAGSPQPPAVSPAAPKKGNCEERVGGMRGGCTVPLRVTERPTALCCSAASCCCRCGQI
jgi:hypothetical protein